MSATPDVISPQMITENTQCWKGVHLVGTDGVKPGKVQSADASSSSDELNTKVRKPYTITKQRERWTEIEHQKFLEALKLYGRAWRRIEEYIGTKTAVQIRSHAQKFFSKGRKAFQALFASKSLPQTFPSAEERDLIAKDECVSRPTTVSRDEAKVTGYGRIRLNAASGEKQSKEIDCTNDSGNLKLCNDSQRFAVQARLATSKGFTVSSSSGFVPYRKLCFEPLKVAQR